MEYFWFVAVGVSVGLVAGHFLQGNNFGILGDVVFALGGALTFGIALGLSGASPEAGLIGKSVVAAIGAMFALFLRRVLKVA